jgi:hypothetical protein
MKAIAVPIASKQLLEIFGFKKTERVFLGGAG